MTSKELGSTVHKISHTRTNELTSCYESEKCVCMQESTRNIFKSSVQHACEEIYLCTG